MQAFFFFDLNWSVCFCSVTAQTLYSIHEAQMVDMAAWIFLSFWKFL